MADRFLAGDLDLSGRSGGANKEAKKEKKKERKKKSEFEFCKVCRINHNDGRRHNYFGSHTKSLSALFSRFQKKVSNVRSCLKNPKLLTSEESERSRIWCIFCEMDIDEQGSSFESNNAIRHLASEDHLKALKHFLWKYGGGMNKVDSFRVTETELSKWEKKCEVLQSKATEIPAKSDGSLHGLSTDDIQPKHQIMKNLDNNNVHFMNSSLSHDVVPLQYNTNENYQVSHSDISHVVHGGPSVCCATSSLPLAIQYNSNAQNSTGLGAYGNGQYFSPSHVGNCASKNHTNDSWLSRNHKVEDGTSTSQGIQILAQIPARGATVVTGNVHSGAPPPWFDSSEADRFNVQSYRGITNPSVMPPSKSVKSSKLNPKRVGAAWAEKRKIEMEMEKRGEIVANVGADWLPNFGRVWQSGSRKDSKKEFEKEKRKLPDTGIHPEAPVKIQPYISKRMRGDLDKGSSDSTTDIA